MANPGNLNSEIGLPLAVMGIRSEHQIAILEMGMNRPGEMDILADIARPSLAAITNIGMAHVGPLGSQREIANEKARIFKFVDKNGWGFLHEDESYRDVLAEKCRGGIEYFGPGSTEGFQGAQPLGLEGSRLMWCGRTVTFSLIGRYNVLNALCAISVAQKLGVPDEAIAQGLEDVEPLFGRGQVLKGDITLIQDCYNANAESMIKAIEFVGSLSWTGRKILVLGSMKELGAESESEHRRVGGHAADSDADAIFFFGEESAAAYLVAKEKSRTRRDRCWWTSDFEELERAVNSLVRTGDLVLLKGSRGLELERLGGALVNRT